MSSAPLPLLRLLATTAAAAAVGCSSESPPASESACVQVDVGCAPLYPPSFQNLFARTLKPTCAQAGAGCHASAGAQGGLVLETEDGAYAALLNGHVKAGDPSCSLLVERLYAPDPVNRMPPGRTLSDPERCAFVRWVAEGAKR